RKEAKATTDAVYYAAQQTVLSHSILESIRYYGDLAFRNEVSAHADLVYQSNMLTSMRHNLHQQNRNWWNTNDGIPAYALGGDHSGGLRIVGERGPELELTGPSRIMSNEALADLLTAPRGDDKETIQELREQNNILRALLRHQQA